MQSHLAPVGPPPPPTSLISLPYELREQIYRLILHSLPRVKPMLHTRTVPIYCLQNLDPRPLFVHPQVQHDIHTVLACHTRIQIPAMLGHDDKSLLSGPTQTWLQESGIEFRRVRVWSDLPVPIILDLDVIFADADAEAAEPAAVVQVHYKWRFRPCLFRLYSWGRCILPSAVRVMLAHLASGLQRSVSARGGTGVGAGEIDFLMGDMDRFRRWVDVHRLLRSGEARLPAEAYEEVAVWRWVREDERESIRGLLRWWDGVEADVRELEIKEGRMVI